MDRKNRKYLCLAAGLIVAFALWTAAVVNLDVQAIGPEGTSVGLAGLNRCFHELTGVHMALYVITDWLGLVPAAFGLGFALLGLAQWIRRRKIRKVDGNILALGVFYIAVLASYLFFESHVVNYRPVLIEGRLEASYPSSTTMLVMCVMPTAVMQLNMRIHNEKLRRGIIFVIDAFILFMVLGRLISGVHGFSDIFGGALLSAGLVAAYRGSCKFG